MNSTPCLDFVSPTEIDIYRCPCYSMCAVTEGKPLCRNEGFTPTSTAWQSIKTKNTWPDSDRTKVE